MSDPTSMLLREAIDIPERINASDFVLELHKGVEQAGETVGEYVVTPALAHAFDDALGLVSAALGGRKDLGAFLHGSFGSGKSHFMAVLHLLLAGNTSALALSGLQKVVSDHHALLSGERGKLLALDYHLIGAASFEQAIFSGYLSQVARLHPGADLPVLHRTDRLFADAAGVRSAMGDDTFFTTLNAATGAAAGGWAALSGGWNAASYDAAAASGIGSGERDRLASALVRAFFSSYTQVGEWQDIDTGLGVMAAHAQSLGYSGVVLFLDELVLWLAGHLADQSFVSREGAKVAKLVETGIGVRAVPIVSFIARQRDLRDFLGDSVPGAQRVAIGQTFQWWEGRFDRIEIKANNLADVAQRRLLAPVSDAARDALAAGLAKVKRATKAWDSLLADEIGAGEAEFAKVYPFSPAVVDTLVTLSSQLQRERTALKVMAQLLSDGRDRLTVADVIPVGDLYDVMVEGGDDPLTEEMKQLFVIARKLYREKLRPVLLVEHALDEATLAAADAATQVQRDAFAKDDRLVKTLIISALAPTKALKDLTASRLAYLNPGSVTTPIPGTEVTAVLAKLRSWAQQIGELEIAEGNDPVVSLQLTGVDYDGIIDRVRAEDNEGARRTLLRRLVFEQLGLPPDTLLTETPYPVVWRGTKRNVTVVFGNIRDRERMPDDLLRASGDDWKVVVDYPFDGDPGMGPMDDVARVVALREAGVTSRTLAWIPAFFTQARQNDLGKLVLLEHLVGGSGSAFDQHSLHLPADQRPIARNLLDSQRRSLRDALAGAIRAAYGITKGEPGDIDTTNYGSFRNLETLDEGFTPQKPVAANLKEALGQLVDQMLSSQYPDHPAFEPSTTVVSRGDLNTVLAHVAMACAREDRRVDPVEQGKRPTLRRVANKLGVGEMLDAHYAFNAAMFRWRNPLVGWASAEKLEIIPVARAREFFAPYGMPTEMQNLVLAAWALLDDKQWTRAGAPVSITSVEQVADNLELRQPDLPGDEIWQAALPRAGSLFGVHVSQLKSAANLIALAGGVRSRAGEVSKACADLVKALRDHVDLLGLVEDSPRLRTAVQAADLARRLSIETDDLVLVTALAETVLPSEPQAIAKSMTSAHSVNAALSQAQWGLLDSVASLAPTDPRRADADALLAALAEVAQADELHAPLAPALATASNRVAQVLVVAPTPMPSPAPTPQPVPAPGPGVRTVDDIPLDGLDDTLATIRGKIEAELRDKPGSKAHITWRVE